MQNVKAQKPLISPLYYILLLIVLSSVLIYRTMHPKVEVKEVVVEVSKNEVVIDVPQKFVLTGAEYTKNVLNNVTVTSYNNHKNQTDNTPNVTSTSRPVREGIVAVSRDLLKNGTVKYGDLLYIDCFDKWYTVEDTMHDRFTKHVDIFLFDKATSLTINKKCGIEIIHITK